MNISQKIVSVATGVCAVVLLAGVVLIPKTAAAENSGSKCDFSRDLYIGSQGEDVRCLQRYLNTKGFTITSIGLGSPGMETDKFGGLTQEAIIRWQTANGIYPATGAFGPKSRAQYALLFIASPVPASIPVPPLSTIHPDAIPPAAVSSAEQKARTELKNTINDLEDAIDQIDEADDNGDEIGDARDLIEEAQDSLLDALYAFVDKDFEDVMDLVDDTNNSIEDALNEIEGNSGDEDDAQEALDDADNAIDDAREEINQADDDGDDVGEAEDLLNEAKDTYRDAQDAFDDEDFDEAIDLANEAEDLAGEAVDAIGN